MKKFDIFYNFITTKVKTRLRLVKKFVLFMEKVLYQNQQRKNGSHAFVLEIWMSKMHLALVDQSLKTSMKSCRRRIEEDHHISSSHGIGKELNIDHKTVLNHLKKAGYKKKLDVWVPHELTQKNLLERVSICDSLLKRNEIDPFLKRMLTGDEKWIRYDNGVRK